FFWIDASVCPFSIPWFDGVSIKKDPLPNDNDVDLSLIESLDDNRTLIMRYPELFLSVVGLSRSFTDTTVRASFWSSNDDKMGLLDFVKFDNPIKVKTGKRTLAENEVSLLTETEDRVISPAVETIRLGRPPVKRERASGVVIIEPNPTIIGKSPNVIHRLIAQSGQPNVGSGSAAPMQKSLFPLLLLPLRSTKQLGTDPNISKAGSPNSHVQIMTEDVAAGLVNEVGLLPFMGKTGASSSIPNDGPPIDDFFESQHIDFSIAQDTYVSHWAPIMCRNLVDHVPPSGYWASLRNCHDSEFLDLLNSSQVVLQRDAKIVDLKAKVEKAEREAMAVSDLHRRVSDLEAEAAARSKGVASLTVQNADAPSEPTECRAALGEVISMAINKCIQKGLEAVIEHVNKLDNLSFPLLEELDSFKDSLLELFIPSLTL
ncbi:hypothetical protein Tco_0233750, partial [Tanacetum coccineum]